MAGGIDWFRWHHGSVTDPKFQLVARRASATVAEVIAMWACLLEAASSSVERGLTGPLDFEALDCALGLQDGRAGAIFQAMRERGLVDDQGWVAAWEKRQPKRERSDEQASTDRVRAFRERKRCETPRNASPNIETSVAADGGSETPRGEERREELSIEEPYGSSRRRPVAVDVPPCPQDQIVALYHDRLPELPRVKLTTDKRQKAARDFWRWVFTAKRADGQPRATGANEAMEWIADYFDHASGNDFLMGRKPSRGHEAWRADFDFLLSERGRKHVIERTAKA